MKLPVQLTLLPAASRNDLAKTCQLQETKKELKQNDQDYGLNSAELLAMYDQDTQSWRTSQHSLVETTGGGLERFLETWPRSGMTRNGTAYRLPNLVRTITEIGSGLLPTPVKSDATTGQIIGKNDTFKMTKNGNLRKYNGKGTNGSLGLARYVKFWPTPNRSDYKGANMSGSASQSANGLATQAVKSVMWPTPTARDYKGARSTESLEKAGRDGTNSLPDAFVVSKISARLNPQFVEALMGYPITHTDLKD